MTSPYTVQNFPGPYEVEILYIVAGEDHIQRINTDVQGSPSIGDDSSTITLETRNGAGVDFETAVDDYIAIVDGVFNATDTEFVSATLNRYEPLSTAKDFISQYDIGLPGIHASPTNLAHQYTTTYRTQEGGIMRLMFLETVLGTEVSVPLSSVTGEFDTLADFVISPANWMLARDTSYPITKLKGTGGENERLFRLRFR